jgi:hypothetical protein
MSESTVPQANLRGFEILFSIENSLRELIIEELSHVAGPQWLKTRLPGDVLQKFREGVQFERKVKWVQLVPHHPVYYIDFPDLRKIIMRGDNWKDAFRTLFQSQEVLEGTLLEIELIRNKVAHNRKLSDGDLAIVEGARTKLSTAIGNERFSSLAGHCTHIASVKESARKLLEAVEQAYCNCRRLEPCGPISEWLNLLDQWWFDAAYTGAPTEKIEAFLTLMDQYRSLPRVRGEGHKLEQWLRQSAVDDLYQRAKQDLVNIAA